MHDVMRHVLLLEPTGQDPWIKQSISLYIQASTFLGLNGKFGSLSSGDAVENMDKMVPVDGRKLNI
jgi:hypothetical protein